jgi:hypothetical protein
MATPKGYIPKEPAGKKQPVRTAEQNGIHFGTFQFTDPRYPGKKFTGFYSKDTANGDFLKVYKINFGSLPWEYTTPSKSDFKKIMEDGQPGQTAYYDEVGRLKLIVENQNKSQNRGPGGSTGAQIDQALNQSGTSAAWNASVSTPQAAPQATTPPPSAPAAPISDPVSGQALTLDPDLVKEILGSSEETIKSLNPPGSKDPVIISYPVDALYGNTQDHVLIEQFTYRAPQEELLITGKNQFTTNFAGIVTKGLTRNSNLRDFIGMVKLPIPNQLAISNGVSWGEDRANPVEAAAFFGALPLAQQALGGNLAGTLGGAFSGFGQFMDQVMQGNFGANTPAGLLLSSFIAQYALGKIGINVDPAQFIARGTGTTINPNLELLFNGPKLRSFSFTFEFAPIGLDDAYAARRVMRFFRQGMAPKKFQSTTILIGSPNIFRISYKGNGGNNIKGLNRFKICALTACELNYTPEGVYQSYEDPNAVSMPVRTNMTLSFTELTPIFEQDYLGKNDPSVDDVLGGIAGDEITFDEIGF